jgi:hypothetical protein
MLARGELERVPASREHADVLLDLAQRHLSSAQAIAEFDASGSTSRGGHIAVREAVSAQVDPPLGSVLRPFDRIRRRRNQAEYPAADSPTFDPDEVVRDLPKVREMVDVAVKLLDRMSPF